MTAEPRRDSSGTTCTDSFSSTAHVRARLNVSPMRTAPALVRHQHRMGSTSTLAGPGGAVAGVCADAARPPRSSRKHNATRISLRMGLPQPPLRHELAQRNVGFGLIQPDRHDIDVVVFGSFTHLVLPLACAIGE